MTEGSALPRSSWRSLFWQGNVRILAIAGIFTGTYVSMLNATIQPFSLSLGIGLTLLGVMQALGSRGYGLAGSIIQPFSGKLSDTYGRRRVMILGSLTFVASMISFLAAGLAHNWLLLIPGYLLMGLSLLSTPASQALIAESADVERKKMNVAFSMIFFFNQVPGAVMPFVAGVIADLYGYQWVFLLAMGLEVANLLLYVRRLKETKHETSGNVRDFARTMSPRSLFVPPKGFRRVFATFITESFAFSMIVNIFYGMTVKEFGYSTSEIGLMVSMVSIATLLGQYPSTLLLLRFGSRISLAISMSLYAFLLLGWNLSNNLTYFLLLSVPFGLSNATWVPALQSMVMAIAPASERSSLSGRLAALRGLIAFPAPILGGFLYDALGYHAPLTAGLAVTVITVAMIVWLLPREGPGSQAGD